jgi:hypothetical protein
VRLKLSLLAILTGCEADPQEAACRLAAEQPATVEIGGGSTSWEPLGAAVEVASGPQGGWHVFGSLRTTGVWPGSSEGLADETTPIVGFTIAATDGSFAGGYASLPRVWGEDGEYAVLLGEVLVLDVRDPSVTDGAAVRIEANVTDSCGTTVDATVESVLAWGG